MNNEDLYWEGPRDVWFWPCPGQALKGVQWHNRAGVVDGEPVEGCAEGFGEVVAVLVYGDVAMAAYGKMDDGQHAYWVNRDGRPDMQFVDTEEDARVLCHVLARLAQPGEAA